MVRPMAKPYYCPDCGDELQVEKGCGSLSYFCPTCKMIKSSKTILEEPPKKEQEKGK